MKILLIDDQRSARRVLRLLLSEMPDMEILEAGSIDEAKERVEKENPDALLVDIRLTQEPTRLWKRYFVIHTTFAFLLTRRLILGR